MNKNQTVSEKKVEDQGALAVQVGGGHYKKCAIQPVEYSMKNNLNFCQGNIIKYATRYADKNGPEDLEKVKHYVDLTIELEYPEHAKKRREQDQAEATRLNQLAFNQGYEAGMNFINNQIEEAKAKKLAARRAEAARKKRGLHTLSHAKTAPAQKKFFQDFTADEVLAKVIGSEPAPRTKHVQNLWAYIKKHNLQDPKNKRNIICDDNLKAVMGGKAKVTIFEMTSLVTKHLK